MDVFTKEKRSELMSRIKSADTKFEILIRKLLFAKGFRFRKNVKSLPGAPDIVLPKYKTIIFINGCFWHGHSKCPSSKLPKTRVDFWERKIHGNILRDRKNKIKLNKNGWKVIVLWECKLKQDVNKQFDKLVKNLQIDNQKF